MKPLKYLIVLSAFIGLSLIGCTDKSQSPVESARVTDNTVSLNKDSGPGAWIFNDEVDNWDFWFIDWENEIAITIGLHGDPWSSCNGTWEGDIISLKELYLPNADPDLRRNIEQARGKELITKVWKPEPWPSGSWNTYCEFWQQANPSDPIAVGTAKVNYLDTDVYLDDQGKNTEVVNGKANGSVTDQNGKVYNLNIIFHLVIDANGKYKQVIKVQLVPKNK